MAVTKRQNKAKKVENMNASEGSAKLGAKEYERELAKVHGELVKLKVLVVFEGRDGAGKGGVIKAITERVSPGVFRVVALPAPTERDNICDARTGAFAGLSTARP
jgi:polyphosphate kinase 2 (PPK2 family)